MMEMIMSATADALSEKSYFYKSVGSGVFKRIKTEGLGTAHVGASLSSGAYERKGEIGGGQCLAMKVDKAIDYMGSGSPGNFDVLLRIRLESSQIQKLVHSINYKTLSESELDVLRGQEFPECRTLEIIPPRQLEFFSKSLVWVGVDSYVDGNNLSDVKILNGHFW
jgi:hypothetical protein